MSYKYRDTKSKIFEEENQKIFLKIRDNINRLLADAGAVSMGRAIKGTTGDSWVMLACVDRLVELGEIEEIPRNCIAQHRLFIKPGK